MFTESAERIAEQLEKAGVNIERVKFATSFVEQSDVVRQADLFVER